jgi:hypothetical protein
MATLVNREMWLVRSDVDVIRVFVTSQNLATAECDVIPGMGGDLRQMTVSAYDLYEQEAQARVELLRREKLFSQFMTKE